VSAPAVGLRLGAPGVYLVPQHREPAFQPVRLDVAGFVGVALRGPVNTPTLVQRSSDYEQLFGAFERATGCPERLLPYAVQAFFAQGGERAYVLRVAPPADAPGPDSATATARFELDLGPSGAEEIAAANEGSWGGGLVIRLEFDVVQRFRVVLRHDGFDIPAGADLPVGSLLRLPSLPAGGVFRWVTSVAKGRAVLDVPLPINHEGEVEVINGALVVTDSGSALHREERVSGLGLRPGHPRFVPGVLDTESLLVRAAGEWSTPLVPPDPLLRPVPATPVQPGADRCAAIDYRSFFDDGEAANDPLDECCHRGVDAMGRQSEIGLLCVPDLYWRAQQVVPPPPPAPVRISCCPDCCAPGPDSSQTYAVSEAVSPALDARNPADLEEIVKRQQRLVTVADLRRRFVALLDVPAGLSVQGIARWRAGFQSSYAAAYHPWLGVPRQENRREAVSVPPSAFAAGITAARERRLGLPWGPANELAVGAVRTTDLVSDIVHDQLHLLGINVFRAERDGFRLTAARTLSSDPDYRQLSVRRVMTMIALTLDRHAQRLVFEPNTADLRGRLQHIVTQFLRDLHRRNAFAGATEAESFFVRCDEGLNPSASQALGRLIAEVGVAPAAPLEYLVLRISQDADGTLQVATGRG
jgi:uncharacterized protein